MALRPPRVGLLEALRWPLVALLIAGAGVSGARAAESWDATAELRAAVGGAGHLAPRDPRLVHLVAVERQLSLVQLGVTAAIGIVFLVWWAIAYRNLSAMGIRPRRGTTWAVASWFMPLASLVAPKRIAEELYWGSDATTPIGWRYGRGVFSGLVSGWWSCWLASLFLPTAALVVVMPAAVAAGRLTPPMVGVFGGAFVASAALLGVAGLCASALVIKVTDAQRARAEALVEAGLTAGSLPAADVAVSPA